MKDALKKMANGKASGEDGLVIEFLKAAKEGQREMVRKVINKIWKEGELPDGWKLARIVPIYKSGEKDKVSNYRGVALLNVDYKLLTKMMATRLGKWAEKNAKSRESQAGFREKRGMRDQILVLNSLINNRLKHRGKKLYVAFIDFRAAFDKVNRKKLSEKLRKKGIDGHMYEMIKEIYRKTTAEVMVNAK